MTKLEKVIKGMDSHCTYESCDDCPYDDRHIEPLCLQRLLSDALELLKEDERRLQEFNRNCYMSDDLPPIGGFHDDSCEEDDLYDTPIGGFHD